MNASLPSQVGMNVRRRKIKIFLGSYVNCTQAQCLNCRSLLTHLDRERFVVGARSVYSGDLGMEEFARLPATRIFKVRYPGRVWSKVQFVRGLLWCDVAYLPSPELWRWARVILKLTGKKAFKTVEGAFIGTNMTKALKAEGSRQAVVESLTYTGNVYSITEWMKTVNERELGLKTRAEVLYLGVEVERFRNSVRRERLSEVAIIGSNLFYKGLDDFFELAKRFPQLKFHIIGSGMGKVNPKEAVGRLGLANCVAHGALRHSQLAEVLRGVQLHVFPSRAEGFPKVTLETAAAGVPSLVYGDYGAAEWISSGTDGFVVSTLEEMSAVIQRLIDHPELLQPLADNARRLAQRFDWKVLVKDWEREMERIYAS